MLVLIAGLPGTGKTTVAKAFARRSGAVHLNSDTLRLELGLMGHYSPEDKEKVYATLLERARTALLEGKQVVVDSTFFSEKVRAPFQALAEACGVPLRWIEVKAAEQTLRQRLSRPRPDSEADFSVYEKIRDQFEPLPDNRLILNTDTETPESAALKIQTYLE